MRDPSAFTRSFGMAAVFLALGVPAYAWRMKGLPDGSKLVWLCIIVVFAATVTGTCAYFARQKWSLNRMLVSIVVITIAVPWVTAFVLGGLRH